jgi:AraC-like DNA-binding protein
MEILNLYIDPQRHPLPRLPKELQPVLQSFIPLHPGFYHRCNRRVRIRFEAPSTPAALLRAIAVESGESRALAHREALEALLSAFLIVCARQVANSGYDPGATPGEGSGALERMRLRLDSSCMEQHRLEDLARDVRMTPEALCRAFKRYTGKSVFEYIHQRRIENAAFALRNTEEKVVSVAFDCGFRDVSFFNRKFRALMGCSPVEYRKLCRSRGA